MKRARNKSNLSIVADYLSGTRPFVQVGYDPNQENGKRKEGEEWKDSKGDTWIWKSGYKQKLNKRSTLIIEQRCKSCNADVRWGDRLDKQVWPKSTLCYECYTNEMTQMKLKGTWELHNELRDLNNEKSIVTQLIKNFTEAKKWCEEHQDKPIEFLEEDGSFEKWEGIQDYNKILIDINKDLKEAEEGLITITNKIVEVSDKLKEKQDK